MDNHTRALILIHGFLRLKFSMIHLAPIYRRKNYRVYSFNYLSLRGSINLYSDNLASFILRRVRPDLELNFITHSLGSIVLRRLVQKHILPHKLGRAVMLGPPNQGSEFARKISKSKLLSRLLGPTLVELGALSLPEDISGLEVGVISGATLNVKGLSPYLSARNDGTVLHTETTLSTAKDFINIPCLHSFMMYSPSILKQTSYFLENGRFLHETPSNHP